MDLDSSIVIVAADASVGGCADLGLLRRALEMGDWSAIQSPVHKVVLDGAWVKFPPRDLEQALPQQNLLLRLAHSCSQQTQWDSSKTGIWVGMETDVNVCRYGARWRLSDWADALVLSVDASLQDSIVNPLQSAGVLGCMPNIPANRLNSQLDCLGASGTVSAEEGSGLRAVQLAMNALRRNEIDVAIVAAVDCANNPMHVACKSIVTEKPVLGLDGAAMLVLKRAEDVPSADVMAYVESTCESSVVSIGVSECGDAHAAHGLIAMALSSISDRTERIDSLDMFGTTQSLVIKSNQSAMCEKLASRLILPSQSLTRRSVNLTDFQYFD